MNASDYRITITPLSPEADARVQMQWRADWEQVYWSCPEYSTAPDSRFNEGHIMAVPFKVESWK